MQLDKDTILSLLRSRGEHEKAAEAEQELPDKVDPSTHAGLLDKFGVNPQELLGGLGGLGRHVWQEGVAPSRPEEAGSLQRPRSTIRAATSQGR